MFDHNRTVMRRSEVFTLTVNTSGRIVIFRAGVIVSIVSVKDTSRLTFADFANMAHSITRKANFYFRNKRYISWRVRQRNTYLGRICPANFKHTVREGTYLVSPSTLILLFRRLTSTTLYSASRNSRRSASS